MHQPIIGEEAEQVPRFNWRYFTSKISHQSYFRYALVTIKILLGLALLILSVRGIQWKNLVLGMRSANLAWLTLTIFVILFGLVLKLWRWALLVRNYHIHVTPARLFSAYFVGQATNIVLPFRGGELVRLGYFANDKDLLPRAASTIIIEKYLDLLALTVCAVIVSLNLSLGNMVNIRTWLLPLSIGLSVLLFSSMIWGPSFWEKIRARNLLPQRLAEWINQWVHASLWLRKPTHLLPSLILTLLIWGVMWFTNLLLFKSLGLPLNITAGGAVLVLVYVALFPALMPGNIGPFYFFARLALLPFGIINEQAIVFAVLLHAIVMLPPLLGGSSGLFIRSEAPVQL